LTAALSTQVITFFYHLMIVKCLALPILIDLITGIFGEGDKL